MQLEKIHLIFMIKQIADYFFSHC